ncbi:MAG: FHA domain-containing protein [Anaerolineales bacterium]|jgi:pSer/pThr/pTyr-binding forkhead associated (FHA) protein
MAEEKSQIKTAYLILNAQAFPILKELTTIGRKLDNDLVIQDVLVSRHHAEIVQRDGAYFIRDKNSTGGTYLNNKRITEAQLFSNDLILLANTPLMFIQEDQKFKEKSNTPTDSLPRMDEETGENS